MGQNSRGGGRANRSKLSDAQAFELCHADVREALRTCVFSWSAAWALNHQRRYGSAATVTLLRQADDQAIRRKGWWNGVKSPCVSARVKPLYCMGAATRPDSGRRELSWNSRRNDTH